MRQYVIVFWIIYFQPAASCHYSESWLQNRSWITCLLTQTASLSVKRDSSARLLDCPTSWSTRSRWHQYVWQTVHVCSFLVSQILWSRFLIFFPSLGCLSEIFKASFRCNQGLIFKSVNGVSKRICWMKLEPFLRFHAPVFLLLVPPTAELSI